MYKELLVKELFCIDYDELLKHVGQMKPSGNFNNRNFYDFPCHLNPLIFMSPVICVFVLMITKYQLNLVELLSMIRAFAAILNTTYYLTRVLLMMIEKDELEIRGVELGRKVLMYTKTLYLSRPYKTKIIGLRFQWYNKILIPNAEQWEESVRRMMFSSLIAFQMDEYASSKEKERTIYKETLMAWQEVIPHAGPLITNHILGIAAVVGVVPFWFLNMFHISILNRSLKYFRDNYNLQTGSDNINRFF